MTAKLFPATEYLKMARGRDSVAFAMADDEGKAEMWKRWSLDGRNMWWFHLYELFTTFTVDYNELNDLSRELYDCELYEFEREIEDLFMEDFHG